MALRKWLGNSLVRLGLRVLKRSEDPPEDLDQPVSPVVITAQARSMIEDAFERRSDGADRSRVVEKLAGSARERLAEARARREMGR